MSNLTGAAAGNGAGSGRYAIVGYGFRMHGGVYTAGDFRQLLSRRGFIREPVAARYGPGYEPVLEDAGPSRFAASYEGLMRGDEPHMFDCRLFGISTREASVIDPQMRMLLTCAWEALEQACWDHAGLRNRRTGVFVGAQVSPSGSWRRVLGPNEFIITGTSLDMPPNRISYAFNLTGPSAAYLTACSSGATALHAAVTALDGGLQAFLYYLMQCSDVSAVPRRMEGLTGERDCGALTLYDAATGDPEFWLAGAWGEDTQRLYEAFGAGEAGGSAVRFATADLSEPAGAEGGAGETGLTAESITREISETPAPARLRPLAGALPGPCQEDLELLQNTIRELAGGRPGGQPVPADQFGAVFLTGATGFVGRFVLSELLKRSDRMLVHCLVRAPDAKQALARVQDALESAGLWEDFLADRIRAWPGDMREPRFGLPELDFRRLCGQVDAVYHLAAELSLLSPYAALREASTSSARTVLELALRRRPKHLVYASTMGIFPQYFCNFASAFAGQAIGDSEQPDPDLMTSVFPPGMMGYPWSKLVVERALLSARSAGLPVAIMRLPQMGIAARTGYTRSSDIKIRIAMAALDVGVMPSGFRLQWTEPVDTVSELLTAISLNPRRRHTLYHLCNPAPQTWGLELADFGFDLREVSYAEFKQACQARGPRGPLHGHWPLVDRFARYWFSAGSQARPVGLVSAGPVSARAVENDAPDRPAWPGLVTMTVRSSSWISRQPSWPYRRPTASADAEALRRRAERIARRLDVRFADAYPPELLEGLGRLAGALAAPEARIRADRLAAISFELGRKLTNRAALAREYASQPAIAREPVEQPVFILGINRTGTTFLHRLLAQGPRFWALYPHELAHPALPVATGETGRRQYAADVLAASGIAEAMAGIDPGEPEEEFALLEDSFAAWSYTMRYHVPEYARWLDGQDGAFAYGVHRRTMQHLSWQRGTRLGAVPRQWLLKMPFHLAELETLVATYPDAIFIQTHREPREIMPSWLSLTEAVRSLSAQPGDPAAIGAEQLDFMSRMLGQAARFRAAYPEIDRRFVDVSYLDLTENPVGTVAEIYRHFGWVLDDETWARTERWQAARRRAEPRDRYSLARYGLTAPQVDAAFARYAEFVRTNKVRLE